MIPRFAIMGTCVAADDWEAEGTVLQIVWLGLVFEFTLARIDRRFGDAD